MKIFLKILKWTGLVLLAGFIVLVGFRTKHVYDVEKTNAQIEKIHNTKLQMSDVMGDNLPPDPGSAADATIEGVDANTNGIRDDVELAIFKEYPNSAKTRAVLLQYALALQTQMTLPFINKDVFIASLQEEDRSFFCIGDIFSRKNLDLFSQETDKLTDFINNKQLNTLDRKNHRTEIYKNMGSYNSLDHICDIDYTKLPN